MPIRDREDAAEVEARIGRVFGAPPAGRAAAVRELFVEALDFDAAQGHVRLQDPPAGAELPDTAERVAVLDGVHVLYVALDAPESGRVNAREATAAAKLIADQLGDDLLLVFSNTDASQLHFVRPDLAGPRPTLRRMVVERDLPQRTAMQQVSNIYRRPHDTRSIREALDEAFDVEPVTRDFFREYRRVFEQAEQGVSGFADEEDEERRLFVQTLFNRLMFVYFLQRKGWLEFQGDRGDYLNDLWRDYQSKPEQENFYRDRLCHLFFFGLNNEESLDFSDPNRFPDGYMQSVFGKVPFLNGGLFEKGEIDQRDGVTVPDSAIALVLTDLFDRFNFTVMESTPFDIEVAVDPEMLGKVFEELVTGRHESGSYYTPRPVVSFMCREALKGYLEARETALPADAIAAFVDERQTDGIEVAAARRVAGALGEVTVVDPACGSGAYLLGMMQELVELQTALYNAGADAKSLHQLKLEIIQRNLYGVDIDEFAVNIAMLRMWLSLAIEFEGAKPEPLPNLDFKVVCGDSLLGPDPSGLSLDRVAIERSGLGRLKATYLNAHDGNEKERLRGEIAAAREQVRAELGSEPVPKGAIDWRVEFAEVFADGGFDVAIANPPYRQLQKDGGRLGTLYRDVGFDTFVRSGDVYQLFYERGCQLLQPGRGLLAYITSNSWLRAEYGKRLRQYFTTRHTPLRWLDLGKDVFDTAIVDSGVLLLRTGGEATPFPAVDMDGLPGVVFPPAEEQWGRVRPDADAPWSVLSLTEQRVMDKMQAVGTPLAEWDIAINYGIKTGYNEAFIIDDATREALVAEDPKSAEIIRPILRGRDIGRYKARWAGLWVVSTFPALHVDIDRYPAVREHLLAFGRDRLEQKGRRLPGGGRSRKSTGHSWFEAQDVIAYHGEFAKSKLFWMDMGGGGRFSYSETEVYINNAAYMITRGPLKYLCGLLNGRLVTWFMGKQARTTGMGLTVWHKAYVERIPVPEVEPAKEQHLVKLVDRILDVKAADAGADTEEWERAIDRLVYDLYGLTAGEVAAVEAHV